MPFKNDFLALLVFWKNKMKLLKWRTLCNSYAYTFTSETGKFTRAPLNKMKKSSQLSSVRHISEMLWEKMQNKEKKKKGKRKRRKGGRKEGRRIY